MRKVTNLETGETIDLPGVYSVDEEQRSAFHAVTLRDYFAARLPHEEIQEITYRNLSRDAQELLTGLKFPEGPRSPYPGAMPPAEYRLEVVRFNAAVNAALRYIAADAMLKERAK